MEKMNFEFVKEYFIQINIEISRIPNINTFSQFGDFWNIGRFRPSNKLFREWPARPDVEGQRDFGGKSSTCSCKMLVSRIECARGEKIR